jgi:hypothetical protein
MAVKNFLAFDHFLPNFVQIDQIISPSFLDKYEHLIHLYIPNLMPNSNLFTEFSLLFAFYRYSNFSQLDQ